MTSYYSHHKHTIESLGATGFELKTVASSLFKDNKYRSDTLTHFLKAANIKLARKCISTTPHKFNTFNLVSSKQIKDGSIRDCVYFIFHDTKLMKIGKVGGGNRCLRHRAADYRSDDHIAEKIKNALREPEKKLVHMYYIEPPKISQTYYGITNLYPVIGPVLEKRLIETAITMNYELPWNSNKG